MKRTVTILLVVIALIASAVGVGWLYFSLNPEAWDDFIAEMKGETTSSSAPRPVRRAPRKTGGLVASGTIEIEEVSVASEMGGRIVEMLVDEGVEVTAGDVLVRLDQAMLLAQRDQAEAGIAQAQAALDAAQAQLALAESGARPQEIAQAEGAVSAARAALEVAQGQKAAAEGQLQAARASLAAAKAQRAVAQAGLSSAEAQLYLTQAGPTEADLAIARRAVESAQVQLAQLKAGSPEETVEIARLNVELARNALYQAQLERDALKGTPGIPGYQKEMADAAVGAAEVAVRVAQFEYELIAKGATEEQINVGLAAVRQAQAQADRVEVGARPEEVSMAQAGVEAARAQQTQAEVGVEAAQAQVTTAQAGVETAGAGVAAAQARLDQAQATLDLLRAGARLEEIAALEANVAQAEAALANARAARKAVEVQIERTALTAPVSGIVIERLARAGELASPGAPLLTLADLDQVTLTVYVPEADLSQVALGQEVKVTVDAYEEVFIGQVSHIASQAEFTPKNVQTQEERVHMVFAVKVRLDNGDHWLKPGMPADAAFQ